MVKLVDSMRFLVITQYFPPEIGAAPTRLTAMIQVLLQQGHEVEVITAYPNYPTGELADGYKLQWHSKEQLPALPGVQIHRMWVHPSSGKGLGRIINYLSFAFSACFGVLKAKKPDWVFVNSGPMFVIFAGLVAKLRFSRPYIFNVADLWPESILKIRNMNSGFVPWVLYRLEALCYRKARFVTAVTKGIEETLIKDKQLDPKKVLFLPNGVDLSQFHLQLDGSELRRQLGLEDKLVFIYPGTHGYLHALEYVVEAAKDLQDRPVHFLFVGGGSEKPKLQSLAEGYQLKNVSFVDPQPPKQLAKYIAASDVGLIHQKNTPLANETRPAKAFPLMAMAKPLLFAGFGEGADMIKSVEAGEVIPPEEKSLLVDSIHRILQAGPDKEAGLRGRKFVEENLSWQKIVSDWLSELTSRS